MVPSGHGFVTMPIEHPARNKNPVECGVFLWDYARSYMWNTMLKYTVVCYMDTDSALVSQSHYNLLKENGLIGARFGMFKSEGSFDEVYILAPKLYLFINNQNNIIKARAKGVQAKDRFTYENKEYDMDLQMMTILVTNTIKIKFISLKNYIIKGLSQFNPSSSLGT